MERRALLAIVLSVGVLVVWFIVFPPPAPVPPPPAPDEVAAQLADTAEPETRAGREEDEQEPGRLPGDEEESRDAERIQASAAEEFRVETGTHDVRFTNEGGRVLWWRLPDYLEDKDVPVDLIPERARLIGVLPLQVVVEGEPETTAALAKALHVHTIEEIPADDPSGAGPGRRVTFTYADGRGLHVEKSLILPENGYVTRIRASVTRAGRPVAARIVWASGLGEVAEDSTTRIWNVLGRAVISMGAEIERIPPEKVETEVTFGASTQWAGVESTYFASLILPEPAAPATGAEVVFVPRHAKQGDDSDVLLTAELRIRERRVDQRLFVGPKDYSLLKSLGYGLERAIDFSSIGLIYVITKYLFLALTAINQYVGNYGVSIIILTFLVRLALFPVTYRSMINMRRTSKKMAKVQPKVRSIQEKYKKQKRTVDSQQRMNKEIMAVYQREGVNPMSSVTGCLPLLLQMPIFIAFYNLLAVTIEVRHAPFFGWIQDLSQRDPYYITPILMGASWMAQQMMTSSSIPDPMQRRMMMMMPIVFTVMMLNMPSGLVIYWLTSNLLSMAQQYLINRKADAIVGKTATAG